MTIPTGKSLESDDAVSRAMAALASVHQWLEELPDLPTPLPGSVLAEEDRLNPYEPGSHLAGFYYAVACDNLKAVVDVCLGTTPDGARGVPAFALYSQLRASIEAAGWGYWLIVNTAKSKRLYRALCITYGHAQDFEETIRSLGQEWPASGRIERLQEIRDAMPVTLAELKHPPTTSDMFRVVDGHLRRGGLDALNGWKLCSGIAHGSRPIAYNLSERIPLSEADDNGSVQMNLQARMMWIATIAELAVDLLKALRDRYSDLATHDHGGKRRVGQPVR